MAEGGKGKGKGVNPKDISEGNNALQQQLQIMNQLNQSISSMAEQLSKVCETTSKCFSGGEWEKATKDAEKYQKETESTAKKTADFSKKVSSLTGKFAKLAPVLGGVVGAFKGLKQGFTNLFAVGKGLFGMLGSITGALFKTGKAVLSIPFKMLGGLVDMANQGAGAGSELRQAMEDLRESFGFIGPTADTVKDVTKSMAGFSDTGLTAYQVFGSVAERMKYFTELAQQMGPQFALNAEEIKRNGGALAAYQKGLGLTGEQMANIAIKGKSLGKDMGGMLNDMTKQALHMSKAFGLDAKVISKDMGKALQDVTHFGHLSTKQLGAAVVYANKLGVSIDKLTGLMDQFDTFDKAADSTAKLNEQFGTNIDAMELMAAQSPAEKMEMLRKSFAATGKDMSQLSFQERKLIQQTTGLDQATFDAAMSAGDQGDILNDINKEAGKAEDKTLAQADALKELSVQIKRVVNAGGGAGGGFLDRLFGGFAGGIQATKEFQGVMMNIRQSLNIAGNLGAKLGQTFVKAFPGVKQMLGGLKDIFDPARFKKLSDDVMKIVGKYFDPKTGEFKGKFEDMLAELKGKFFDFIKGAGPGVSAFKEGFKKFAEMISKIIAGLINFITPALTSLINKIADWISKPKLPKFDASGARVFTSPLEEALAKAGDMLGPALKKLGAAIFGKLKEALVSGPGKMLIGGALAMVLGPALLQGLAGAGAGGMFKKGIGSILGKQGPQAGAMGAAGQAQAAGGIAATGQQLTSSPAAMVSATVPTKDQIERMEAASKSSIDWAGLTKFLLGMAGMFAIGLLAFKGALLIVKDVPIEDILKGGLVFAEVGGVIAIALKLSPLLENAGKMPLSEMLKGLLAMGLVVGAMVLTAWAIGEVAKKVGIGELLAGAAAMLAMSLVFVMSGVIITEAGAIGLALVASFGIGAGAVLAGLGVMTLVVAEMAITAMKIAESLSQIKEEPSALKTKAEAFSMIMDSISNMMGKIADILDAMDFGFFESGESINERLRLATKFIQTLIDGDPAGSGGISGIISKIIYGLREIPADKVETAKAFAAVLSAVGGMMGSVAQTIEAVNADEATHWWSSAEENGKAMMDAMSGATTLLDALIPSITGLVTTLLDSIKTLPRDEGFAKSATAFGSILGAIGNLMKALTPNMKDFQETVKGEAGSFLWKMSAEKTSINTQAIEKMADYMKSTMGAMKEHLPVLIGALTGNLATQLNRLSPKQLEAMPAIAKILEAVVGLISAISGPKSEVKIDKIEGVKTDKVEVVIKNQLPNISSMLMSLQNVLPKFLSAILDLTKMIPGDPTALKGKIDTIVKIFGAIKSMVEAIKTAGEIPRVEGQSIEGALKMSMWTVRNLLADLAWGGELPSMADIVKYINLIGPALATLKDAKGPEKIAQLFDNLAKLIGSIKSIGENVQALDSMPAGFKTTMWTLSNTLGQLAWGGELPKMEDLVKYINLASGKIVGNESALAKRIANTLSGFAPIMTAVKDLPEIMKSDIEKKLKAVEDMASALQQLDNALSTLPKINIQSKLETVARTAGLGGGGIYTVKTKDVVVNIELKVTMEAGAVEKAIIERLDSKLRKSVNFAIDSLGKDQGDKSLTTAERDKNKIPPLLPA